MNVGWEYSLFSGFFLLSFKQALLYRASVFEI